MGSGRWAAVYPCALVCRLLCTSEQVCGASSARVTGEAGGELRNSLSPQLWGSHCVSGGAWLCQFVCVELCACWELCHLMCAYLCDV